MKKLISMLLAVAMMATMATFALAAEPSWTPSAALEPTAAGTNFFANGTPVTVSAREDQAAGCTISYVWDGKTESADYTSSIHVYGGGNNDGNSYATSSITMTGGTVSLLSGGSLLNGKVGKAAITVSGDSTVLGQGIIGGGLASAGSSSVGTRADAKNSPCRVDEVSITVNNGRAQMLYGGGQGYSSTGKTTINANGGNWDYSIGSGSNGYTGEAVMNMNGGTYTEIAAGNRGPIDKATININGATVTTLFAAGDDTSTDSSGYAQVGKTVINLISGDCTNYSKGVNNNSKNNAIMSDEDLKAIATVNVYSEYTDADGLAAIKAAFPGVVVEKSTASPFTPAPEAPAPTENPANDSKTTEVITETVAALADPTKELPKEAEKTTTATGESVTVVPVQLSSGNAALDTDTMGLVGSGSKSVGLQASVDNGAMVITIPGGFGAITEPGRLYYPLDYSPKAPDADVMLAAVKGSDVASDTMKVGGTMTMPAAVSVTVKTKLADGSKVSIYRYENGKLTLVGTAVVKGGTVSFATKFLGQMLVTTGKI